MKAELKDNLEVDDCFCIFISKSGVPAVVVCELSLVDENRSSCYGRLRALFQQAGQWALYKGESNRAV